MAYQVVLTYSSTTAHDLRKTPLKNLIKISLNKLRSKLQPKRVFFSKNPSYLFTIL